MNGKTFKRITNDMIYDRIVKMDKKLSRINGTARWHTWAISFIVVILGCLITAAFK